MLKRLFVILSVGVGAVALVLAQNTNQQNANTSTTRTRSIAPKPTATPKVVTKSTSPPSQTNTQKPTGTEAGGQAPPGSVLASFDALLEGIRHADIKAVTNAYQNSS